MKEDLKSMSLSQMEQAFSALGEPKFRAKQVFIWLHRGARSFDKMTNLSKPLRAKLDGIYEITAPEVAQQAGISKGRHDQISLAAVRRQLRGVRCDAVSPWQHRVYLLGGRLPDGLQVLCVDAWRTGAQTQTF